VTRSLSRWQAVVLGLVVVLGIGGAITAMFMVGGRYWPWDNSFRIRAGFSRVDGVEAGTRVRVQGIVKGEVEEVVLPATPGGDVVLVLRLKPDVRHLIRSDAVAQIVSEGMVGGKVVELFPGTATELLADNALIASLPTADLQQTLNKMGDFVKKAKDDPMYQAALVMMQQGTRTLEQGERTMMSVQQDAEALKKLPLVGGYVENPNELLIRVNCERNRWWYAEQDLFEPDRAVLTTRGRQLLDELVPKMTGFTQKGTELVVVSFADPKAATADFALQLTRQRSEAVVNYLKSKHTIQGSSWVFWSARKVTALGMGVRPTPVQESDNPPPGRTELLVFVPQS